MSATMAGDNEDAAPALKMDGIGGLAGMCSTRSLWAPKKADGEKLATRGTACSRLS